jgi:hypothetical protein
VRSADASHADNRMNYLQSSLVVRPSLVEAPATTEAPTSLVEEAGPAPVHAAQPACSTHRVVVDRARASVTSRNRTPMRARGSPVGRHTHGRRAEVGQRRAYPVRRGADYSDGGVSPTHRGRARSARRSRAPNVLVSTGFRRTSSVTGGRKASRHQRRPDCGTCAARR